MVIIEPRAASKRKHDFDSARRESAGKCRVAAHSALTLNVKYFARRRHRHRLIGTGVKQDPRRIERCGGLADLDLHLVGRGLVWPSPQRHNLSARRAVGVPLLRQRRDLRLEGHRLCAGGGQRRQRQGGERGTEGPLSRPGSGST